MGEREAPTIFISYSHPDEAWKKRLETHLRAFEREARLEVWSDRRIGGGADWLAEIREAMERARLAILLVSPSFLGSGFIWEEEVPRLLQRRQDEGLIVIPVIVASCAWQKVKWLPQILARPTDGKPLAALRGDQRNAALAALATEILDLLPKAAAPEGGAAAFLRAYRQRLASTFSRWDLSTAFVAQAGGAGKPIEAGLDEMYLPLRLAKGFDINKLDLGGPIGPEELLARRRPLVIRGPAGAGKTTWMRWTFRRLLRMENALPLMLVLRDLALRWQDPLHEGAARSIDTFLLNWVAEHLGSGCEDGLRQCLKADDGPRPVLLVDGWDEVGKLGEELRRKLLGFAAEHPRLLVVVSSRPYGEGRPSHSEGYEVLDIQPLSDPGIQEFASLFFERCYREDASTAAREGERFLRALERSEDAKALARTALLLTMMLLIGRSRPLPEKRHLLYEACIENLLTALPDRKQEEGAQLLAEQWRPDDTEERMRVVAALAAGLKAKGDDFWRDRSSVVASWKDLKSLLPGNWPDRRKTGFLAWLVGPAGLLTDRADGTLAFTHLSFQEYLAAWSLNAAHEGSGERFEAFRRRLGNSNWWETLRLWAALIERQSPDRLDPVFEALLSGDNEELSFAGTVLADGLASNERFLEWTDAFASALAAYPFIFSSVCAAAWASSSQEERKETLGFVLDREARGASWQGWLRLEEVSTKALDRRPGLPEQSFSRAFTEQLDRSADSEAEVSTGRVLSGAFAIWPVDPLEVGLLQLWPCSRRLMGIRLQLAALCGATRDDLPALLRVPISIVDPELEGEIHKLARATARSHLKDIFPPPVTRDLARCWANSCSPCLIREWVLSSYCNPLPNLLFSIGSNDWLLYNPSRSQRYLALSWAKNIAFAYEHLRREFVLDWTVPEFGVERQPWLDAFAPYEIGSSFRSLGRVALAYGSAPQDHSPVTLLSKACRISLAGQPATPAEQHQLADLARGLDPLWLALAKHLARCSDEADRALLVDLAQHPEKREPPLSWGLRYIVRGDVLLEDGSVVTLDELADEAGVPRLPFLDEMEPELEVDWEAG